MAPSPPFTCHLLSHSLITKEHINSIPLTKISRALFHVKCSGGCLVYFAPFTLLRYASDFCALLLELTR